MRTTINLPDELILRAKKRSGSGHNLNGDHRQRAARGAVKKRRQEAAARFQDNHIWAWRSVPGRDLSDTSALLDLMDGIGDLIDVKVLVYAKRQILRSCEVSQVA